MCLLEDAGFHRRLFKPSSGDFKNPVNAASKLSLADCGTVFFPILLFNAEENVLKTFYTQHVSSLHSDAFSVLTMALTVLCRYLC